jgi:hypothetical protein
MCLAAGGSFAVGESVAAADADPAAEARAVAAIRRAAILDTAGAGHPLPLAASWQTSDGPLSFTPSFAIEQIRAGRYVLPWFWIDEPGRAGQEYSHSTVRLYYEPPLTYVAREHLPLTILASQWENLLTERFAAYSATGPDGHALPLSPLGPVAPWAEVGRIWAQSPVIRALEQRYPDPPLVEFLSNNEQPKLGPQDLGVVSNNDRPENVAQRRRIGDAWIERYRALIRGFRDGLEAPGWRAHAIFVGYDALSSSAVGRWGGWREETLGLPGRIEPWPYAWEGASVSYYLHDWAPDADDTVWGPEIEAMNFLPVLAEVRHANPGFWFEMSSWDGQEPGQPSDKREFYRRRHEEWTPERYGGMLQFGMWLLRPRVVREFRNPGEDRLRFGSYFDELLAAVARVHDEPLLADFWQHAKLVPNPVGGHPYQENLSPDYAGASRWFLLDASANPPRPWELGTRLAVYSLALERGVLSKREWLVYTFSPLNSPKSVTVQIPRGPRVTVPAAASGCYSLVNVAGDVLRTVGC